MEGMKMGKYLGAKSYTQPESRVKQIKGKTCKVQAHKDDASEEQLCGKIWKLDEERYDKQEQQKDKEIY